MKPQARSDLLVRELGDEAVVYDFSTHRAHGLNASALSVFRRADGRASPAQIARALGTDEAAVWVALEQLGEAGLLTEKIDLGRRRFIGKLALAVAVPAVWSIVAPTPAYAASIVSCIPAAACMGAMMAGACCGSMGSSAGECQGNVCGLPVSATCMATCR